MPNTLEKNIANKKNEIIFIFKKLNIFVISILLFLIFALFVSVINQIISKIQNFFSVPGNSAIFFPKTYGDRRRRPAPF